MAMTRRSLFSAVGAAVVGALVPRRGGAELVVVTRGVDVACERIGVESVVSFWATRGERVEIEAARAMREKIDACLREWDSLTSTDAS